MEWIYLAAGRKIVRRLTAHCREHLERIARMRMVMNRAALTASPAEDQKTIPRTLRNQISPITLGVKNREFADIIRCHAGRFQSGDEFVERRTSRQTVEVF